VLRRSDNHQIFRYLTIDPITAKEIVECSGVDPRVTLLQVAGSRPRKIAPNAETRRVSYFELGEFASEHRSRGGAVQDGHSHLRTAFQ
jgi:hypothetical protein